MAHRRAAVTIAALLGALLIHNVVLLVRNQLSFDRSHRFAVQREHLDDIAAADNHHGVRTDTATRYALQRRIAGASVLIAPSLRHEVWGLERVSRLQVEVSPVDLPLSRDRSDALVAEASWSGTVRLRGGDRAIHLVIVAGERRYAIAETRRGGAFILLPEARYRELAPEATRRALGWP